MAKIYTALPTVTLAPGCSYVHTGELPVVVHMDDPAEQAMVDFNLARALTVNQDAPIKHARIEMNACSVHMLLVDNGNGNIVGIISSEDILGDKPIKFSQETQIARPDIKVKMIMTPQQNIMAIDKKELKVAKVGDILKTLKGKDQHYALVIDVNEETQEQVISGLFALSQIGRQLDITNMTDADLVAHGLADLQQKID